MAEKINASNRSNYVQVGDRKVILYEELGVFPPEICVVHSKGKYGTSDYEVIYLQEFTNYRNARTRFRQQVKEANKPMHKKKSIGLIKQKDIDK